ncbi:MAG: hypothetical protein M1825_004120 [Sarcosagium campestre]|nr:MAG: hypothetical protein M1825_004120 [Sarcosagium campestre]
MSSNDSSSESNAARALELNKRQQSVCSSDWNFCTALDAPNACCTPGTNCQRDEGGNVACCLTRAKCIGTISSATSTSGRSTSGSSEVGAGGFLIAGGVAPTTAATTTTSTTGMTSTAMTTGGSTANRAYSFASYPSSFSNSQVCSSVFSACSSEFNRCTLAVGGSGTNGVTVAGPGVGATVGQGGASASSVCSSLSSSACHGVVLQSCAFTAAAAVPTDCVPLYGVGAGIAFGLAGQMLIQ